MNETDNPAGAESAPDKKQEEATVTAPAASTAHAKPAEQAKPAAEPVSSNEPVAAEASIAATVAAAPKQRRIGTRRRKISPCKPKAERIAELRRHDTDVGSTEVQIGLLTDRILHLTEHLKVHSKDKHTNYGLRKLVAKRKRLLTYLGNTKADVLKQVKKTLNMR